MQRSTNAEHERNIFSKSFQSVSASVSTKKGSRIIAICLSLSDLFSRRFREGISFPNSVERSIPELPLPKLCAVRFALQNRALFGGEKRAKRCRKKGRKRGDQQRGQKGKKDARNRSVIADRILIILWTTEMFVDWGCWNFKIDKCTHAEARRCNFHFFAGQAIQGGNFGGNFTGNSNIFGKNGACFRRKFGTQKKNFGGKFAFCRGATLRHNFRQLSATLHGSVPGALNVVHPSCNPFLGNVWNTVSRVLFWKRELTEFLGELGEFAKALGEFAFR